MAPLAQITAVPHTAQSDDSTLHSLRIKSYWRRVMEIILDPHVMANKERRTEEQNSYVSATRTAAVGTLRPDSSRLLQQSGRGTQGDNSWESNRCLNLKFVSYKLKTYQVIDQSLILLLAILLTPYIRLFHVHTSCLVWFRTSI